MSSIVVCSYPCSSKCRRASRATRSGSTSAGRPRRGGSTGGADEVILRSWHRIVEVRRVLATHRLGEDAQAVWELLDRDAAEPEQETVRSRAGARAEAGDGLDRDARDGRAFGDPRAVEV